MKRGIRSTIAFKACKNKVGTAGPSHKDLSAGQYLDAVGNVVCVRKVRNDYGISVKSAISIIPGKKEISRSTLCGTPCKKNIAIRQRHNPAIVITTEICSKLSSNTEGSVEDDTRTVSSISRKSNIISGYIIGNNTAVPSHKNVTVRLDDDTSTCVLSAKISGNRP